MLGVADTVIDAAKSGAISHFFRIGGCDGAAPGRNYFIDLATLAPADTVLSRSVAASTTSTTASTARSAGSRDCSTSASATTPTPPSGSPPRWPTRSGLTVRGPQGAFGLRDHGIRPRWFVAGGMGLAPMLSMSMRRMAEWAEPQPVRLFLGVGTDAEVPELTEAGAQLADFAVTTSVWRPGPDWTGTVGTPVDTLAQALAANGTSPDVCVCGPPAMVDAATEVARVNGVDDEHLILERYLPTGA